MKVFACKRYGGYSGGLAVVAANSAEEAFAIKVGQILDVEKVKFSRRISNI